MVQPLPTYLSAPRKQCARKCNRTHSETSKSWAAGRCHRLLRPIISRIEVLRKDPIRFPIADPIWTGPATACSTVVTKDMKFFSEKDAYWVRGRKRARRTYSGRCNLQEDPRNEAHPRTLRPALEEKHQGRKVELQPGEILVPIPILNRSKPLIVDSGSDLVANLSAAPPETKIVRRPQVQYAAKDVEAHFELAENMRRINKTTNAARFKLYEGIYNALEALFKATIPDNEQALLSACQKLGRQQNACFLASEVPRSRSLFGMCLRSVPAHIKEEEKQAAFEADEMGHKSAFDTRVISREIYSELESFGISEIGWKHLKTVVRVHGVQVISDAIQETFLDANFASALVMLCVHKSFPEDAETLLTSLLIAFNYPDPKSPQSHFRDDPALLPLLTLEKFIKDTERVCYYHREVTKLITSGSLSVTWLGTKCFNSIWTSVFRSLSINPFNRDVATFMTSVLPLLCRTQLSRVGMHKDLSLDQSSMLSVLDTTLASVLTTLSAMSLLSSSHARNISRILKSAVIECQLVSSEVHGHGSALIAMANLLAGVEADGDGNFVKQLVRFLGRKHRQLSSSPKLKDRIPSFVCSVARCCGRGSSGDGFEHLQTMLDRLMTFASVDNPEGARVLQKIIVDSAFIFADHFLDPKHLQYAQHIGARMHAPFIQQKGSPSICRTGSETGFRWEEGINEWVMATPAMSLREAQERRFSSAGEDSEFETPIRPTQKRHKAGSGLHIRGRVRTDRCSRVSDFAPASPNESGEESSSLVRPDCLNHDESFQSHCSSRKVSRLTRPRSSKRPVTTTHRAECKLPCSRQNGEISEHSDDELASTSPTSSESIRDVLLEQPNFIRCSGNVPHRKRLALDKSPEGCSVCLQEQSEDELGL